MNKVEPIVQIGLYRHFKGEYYYVTGVSKNALRYDEYLVHYFNVCKPEFGSYSRPLSDFNATNDDKGVYIKNREDNVTGQTHRFERVYDLNFQIGSVSTEQLIFELRNRKDSPIHEIDIEGLMSDVYSKDYVVGEAFDFGETTPKGVYTIATFDTMEEAQSYLSTHQHKRNTRIFKRTFIEVE